MNESTLLKLKVIVERAVRPVKASFLWKKKTREELLAHVTAVFEDELPRCGDETKALSQVEKRFGDPSDLARTLQESVSTKYRTGFYFEILIGPRAGESLLMRAFRNGIMSFVGETIALFAASLLTLPFRGNTLELGFSIFLPMLVSAYLGAIVFAATLLSNGLERALFGENGRSTLMACLLVIASCIVPVLLHFGFLSVMTWFVTDDNRLIGLPTIWGILSAMLLSPCILVCMASYISSEKRHVQEWAGLQLD